ncbi:macrophage migration inhibitory factor-like protein [Strigomonas culicis]|nr:macrophage migration inhibitory factor-like protein [Strigomonas culicis]|eukprot:EPY33911.1 macrophage migration inhibitory factor-like protein [Strigomonas culicis]
MLMPRQGPIAAAERAYRRGSSAAASRKRAREDVLDTTALRHCYVATNKETLTEEALASAIAGWGSPGVFQIDGFTLVRGAAGRHAEVKLLEFLVEEILSLPPSSQTPHFLERLPTEERVLVVGERFPCVACRVMAVPYEGYAQLLPSHGHFYVSTVLTEMAHACTSSNGATRRGKDTEKAARCLASPAAVHTQLLGKKGRVLLK